MSTSEGFHEYVGGYHVLVHQGMFSTLGDIMMHVGDILSISEDVQYIGVFNINQWLLQLAAPHES